MKEIERVAFKINIYKTLNINILQFPSQLKNASGVSGLKGVLFGAKTDLVNRRVVSPKAGHEMAQKLGLIYFEGSSVGIEINNLNYMIFIKFYNSI